MRKWLAFALLFVSACGANSAADGPGNPGLSVGDGTPNSTLATTHAVTQQGDDFFVPDFTFGLADGSVYDTGAVATPIYVIFWAEW